MGRGREAKGKQRKKVENVPRQDSQTLKKKTFTSTIPQKTVLSKKTASKGTISERRHEDSEKKKKKPAKKEGKAPV